MKFTKSPQINNGLSSALQQWLDETLAVLVLYKTPMSESITYKSLSESLTRHNLTLDWFVYDNSPTNSVASTPKSNVTFRLDPTNPGVSKAYNAGFSMAASLGKKWLLLLDQDTHFPIDSIENYHAGLIAFPQENCFVPQLTDRMGVISPFKFRLGNGFRLSSVMAGIQNFHKLHVVNSGFMISVSAFRQANGYDENFPLDFSDYAFIERIRTINPTFVLLPLSANHQHSSLQQISADEELKRFKHFVSAANRFKKKYHPGNLLVILRPFLRAIKLSAHHKTMAFVKQYFDSMMHG